MNEHQSQSKSANIWHYKPWWCQPWSILLTGIVLIGGSWLLFHKFWLTIGLVLLILGWWYYFLIFVPKLFQEYVQKQSSSPT
jgi:hypothetical protein